MLAGCALASGAGRVLAASGDTVWVLLSDHTGAYTEAANALLNDWRQGGKDRELTILPAAELPSQMVPAGVISLGSSALRTVMERVETQPGWAHTPVVAALLPRDGFNAIWKKPPPQVSAAFLDQPFERYLDLIRLALPHLSRVGILVGPETATSSPAMFKAAQDRGLHLSVGRVPRPDALLPTLRTVLSESDVLLVLPDSTLADAPSLQNILMSAYRQRIPVVAYSPALVKAGAAMGLYASPAQVGKQVATMMRNALSGSLRSSLRLAEGASVAVNTQVCKSLGIDPPDAQELSDALKRQL